MQTFYLFNYCVCKILVRLSKTILILISSWILQNDIPVILFCWRGGKPLATNHPKGCSYLGSNLAPVLCNKGDMK